MTLTDEEAEHAAQTLCENGTDLKWSHLPDNEKQAYIKLVRDLAALLQVQKTPEALAVFYAWMGEKP